MTVLFPVLADKVTEGRIDKYINDDDWAAEQKLDGMRILVRVDDKGVVCLQRQGKPTSKDVPAGVYAAFKPLVGSGEWFFDGEMILGQMGKRTLWLFDMPLAGTQVDPTTDLWTRKQMLDGFYEGYFDPAGDVRLLPTAYETADKALLVKRVAENGGEGVMFKHLDKPYEQPKSPTPKNGVRSRWILKAKNWNSVDCVVIATRLDGKDNIQVGVYDGTFKGGNQPRVIGECTALAGDKDAIKVGDVVEIKYLYANDPRAPRLYQPTYPKIRDDKAPFECTIDQLVFCNKDVLT